MNLPLVNSDTCIEHEEIDVTVILVNYNTGEMLERAVDALMRTPSNLRLQTIIIDNASRDDSVARIQARFASEDVILNPTNVGFGRANNQALSKAKGRYVLLLNTDAFVEPGTLEATFRFMEQTLDCGVLGVKLLGRDGSLQPSCRYFPTPWNVFLQRTGLARLFPSARTVDDFNWDHSSTRDCDWVPGCYYLIRRKVIDQVGLFDPRYFLYYEEIDHCMAVKAAGWRVVYFPYTQVVHLGGESAKSDGALSSGARQLSLLQTESELLYFRKHHGRGGLLAHTLLEHLSLGWNFTKQLLRARFDLAAGERRALMQWWRIAWATRFGERPTR